MLDNGLFESQVLSAMIAIWVGVVLLLRGVKKQKQDGYR
jgi:hypothetical protein